MGDSIVSIGIIGAGGMGGQHALNMYSSLAGARLVALSDKDADKMESIARLTGNPHRYKDPYALILDKCVDAVVIASPDNTHAEFVLSCLEEGKPVFCEKPLATNLQDGLRIIEKEVSLGRKLVSLGFNRRFDPWHCDVRKECQSGNLGKPLLWKGVHRNASAMYANSGAFILNNSAGHDVDSARWILDSEVQQVFVCGLKSRESLPMDAQDLLIINMGMENGTRAVAEVYVNASYGYEVSVEVVCQEGVVSTLAPEKIVVRNKSGRSVALSDDFRQYFSESYRMEMASWIESIRNEQQFLGSDAWDGYSAMVVTQGASISLASGKIVNLDARKKPLLYNRLGI
ncbi:Gfo/Idh/MocA family oxidoreductase [uncultured Sphaerochaeta sp.]|uniref:Gfo/Idh/MocA family oxidoreductase n=1 Tax=uncultured Sphaerochaeta sp. TaxID=886478 RepID=UPI002A0A6420|nr:Gfo/Idh/MocA family oxidoreductase [uncultured Sphaerochaeta sp.]